MKNEKNLVVAPALSSKNEAENVKNQQFEKELKHETMKKFDEIKPMTPPEKVKPTEETTQQTTKEENPEKVTPTEKTPQQTTKEETPEKVTPEKTKSETIEELKKRLETELKRLNNKNVIAEKREFYLDCSCKVDKFINELETVETFETNICRLTFQTLQTDNYSRNNFNDYLTISNTALIGKFCNALKQEINAKIENLEMELLKA